MSPVPATVERALAHPQLDPSDTRILLGHVLGVGHAYLIAHGERLLSAEQSEAFERLAARRCAGEPIAYLVGWREFYGRRFRVDRSVLIPRPETELLVELALARVGAGTQVLDLGTGSGNVALSIALERPDAQVDAVDASEAALELARANATALGARNVTFVHGDWFSALGGARFDVIVSNPPYVAAADPHLGRGDLRFEPQLALAAGAEGLDCIDRIARHAGGHLHPGGWLLFEHGFDQGEACRALLRSAGYGEVRTATDLAELPRVTLGCKTSA